MLGVGGRAEDPVVGRRDARLPHQLLGEDLAPFQLGRVLARAEDPQPLALEDVDDPLGQRLLRARRPSGRSPLAWRTGSGRGGRPARSARSARRAPCPRCPGHSRPRHAGRLLELPAEGVLTPPLADHQDFQRCRLPENAVPIRSLHLNRLVLIRQASIADRTGPNVRFAAPVARWHSRGRAHAAAEPGRWRSRLASRSRSVHSERIAETSSPSAPCGCEIRLASGVVRASRGVRP